MSMPRSPKLAQTEPQPLAFAEDPLEIKMKRPKVSNYVLRGTAHQRGRPLGKYALNWIGARALALMLERVFTGQEALYKEARQALKDMGVTKQPRAVHFELLKLIEAVYPSTISKGKLAEMLDIKRDELERALTYLRDFGAVTVGVSILPTGRGEVGIATLDLWVSYQNMLTQQQITLETTKQLHGAVSISRDQEIHIREKFEIIQPELFALEDSEVKQDASD